MTFDGNTEFVLYLCTQFGLHFGLSCDLVLTRLFVWIVFFIFNLGFVDIFGVCRLLVCEVFMLSVLLCISLNEEDE